MTPPPDFKLTATLLAEAREYEEAANSKPAAYGSPEFAMYLWRSMHGGPTWKTIEYSAAEKAAREEYERLHAEDLIETPEAIF